MQLAARKTIHHYQGLSLNELVFYSTNVEKYSLYIIFCLAFKKK
jgi:hypothetical protein